MILSRTKPAVGHVPWDNVDPEIPTLEQFLAKRDYTGAISFLEFEQSIGKGTELSERWLGYCLFHLGDYKKAMCIYENLLKTPSPSSDTVANLACCYFFLGLYPEAEKLLERIPECPLRKRLEVHINQKFGEEVLLVKNHDNLNYTTEDSLSLAALHYLRAHYNEAIDIYKEILYDNSDYLALNVYAALCYYKLDNYEKSNDIISNYLQKYPESATAINLKACNYFKLENGRAAENEIKRLLVYCLFGNVRFMESRVMQEMSPPSFTYGQDLLRHNLVTFRDGDGALKILPPLVGVIPEARLNLVIHHFKQEEYVEAYELLKDLEPSVPQEYVLKGIVNAAIGQETNSKDHLKVAEQYFYLVGQNDAECDTMRGRLCMASYYFLQKQFDDVHTYLTSVKNYVKHSDDGFMFNYGQAKSALGLYKEAEDALLMVKDEKIQNDYIYITHLARAYIMNGKAQQAWNLYVKMESSPDSYNLLELIANDCYLMGHFYYAAKAFDQLEINSPCPEFWDGKRGACIGAFQMIVANQMSSDLLPNIIQLLRTSSSPQVETIVGMIKKWAKEQSISL